jgi:hypothetical protein
MALGDESMSNDDQERILELLRREASHGRQHTRDSSWHDRSPAGRSLVERAWFDSLIVELEADGACPYKPAIASDYEWPDCEAMLASERSVTGLQSAASQVSLRQELRRWRSTSGTASLAVSVAGMCGGSQLGSARLRQPLHRRASSCVRVAAHSGEAVRGHGAAQLCRRIVASLHNMPLVPTAHPVARRRHSGGVGHRRSRKCLQS